MYMTVERKQRALCVYTMWHTYGMRGHKRYEK